MGVLEDADLGGVKDIQFAYFGNCAMHQWGIRCQVCFLPLIREGLFPERVPIVNVEGACATASMAFQCAWKDSLSRQIELTLAIGVEKIFIPEDLIGIFGLFDGGIDNFDREILFNMYREAAVRCGQRFDRGAGRTVFMDTYAIQACYHMWRYGTTQRQIAFGAAKNNYHGSLNPKAQYQFEIPVDKVMEDRVVSWPLTRSKCAPIGDGAAAALVCSEAFLSKLPSTTQNRTIKIRASVLTSGKVRDYDEPSLR